MIHPDDALELGVRDGHRVRVRNNRGNFHTTARVSDDTSPGVLVAPMGWWIDGATDGDPGPQTTTSHSG